MNVIIGGAGEVGSHAAEVLSTAGHGVTVIDLSPDKLRAVSNVLDVRTLVGHCAHVDVLREAGCEKCDLLVAATDVDEINLLSASLGKQIGAKRTIVRVHHTANFALRSTRYAEHLGVDEMLCPEHLTALEIGRAIRNPGSIALEDFSRGQLLMQRLKVMPGSGAEGKKLSNLTLPPSVRLATVEDEAGPHIAQAATEIHEGHWVTVIGETKSFESARKLFSKEKDKRQHIAIMGGGSTSVWLARRLKSKLFSVRLFVNDHARAEELAGKLSHVTVLVADPTDSTTFADEQIDKADVFIAATDDDEHNILGCAQAKARGTTLVIAVVQRTKYIHLLEHVKIDFTFSPRNVAVNAILSVIDVGPVRSVATFADRSSAVYEVHPHKRAKILGHELRNIKLPPQSMIAAIRRDDRVYVPGAEDQVRSGDTLLVIAPVGVHSQLRKVFVAK
ncbi:MAG: Trk system potassium transporter TrkA [Phycisphaerae bacterium]